jgi:hypothetical protein
MKGAKKEKTLLVAPLLVIALAIIWIFYIPLINNYFITDDIACIWFAATKSCGQILFSPEEYRGFSGSNFTPLVLLSFKIDWLLSGMEPRGYYIHNLISLLMTGCALFLFIRLYTGTLPALIGVMLFLLNPVVLSVFSWSSARHYMEGLFCALVSLSLFVRADRSGKVSFLSGCFYLLSALFKEVYVLLPLIAVLLSKRSISERLKNTVPLWVGLCIYSAWRLWMLHGTGGYPNADALGFKNALAGLYKITEILPVYLFGSYHALLWIVMVAMVICLRIKRKIVIPAVLFVILLIPILPVASLSNLHFGWARYVFHICMFLTCIGVLWGWETAQQRSWRRVAVIFVLITVTTLFLIRGYELKASIHEESLMARESTEEFLFSGKEYIKTIQLAWFYDWMRDIQKYFYGKRIDTKIIPDKTLMQYASEERRQEIKSQGYDIETDPEKELRKDVIEGTIQTEGYRITWDLGPYREGDYIIIRGRYKGLYTDMTFVKKKGDYLFGKIYPDGQPHVFHLRVVYRSPQGWEGITGDYKIEIPSTQIITLK